MLEKEVFALDKIKRDYKLLQKYLENTDEKPLNRLIDYKIDLE